MRSNWTHINLVLRNSNNNRHISTVTGLTLNARVVQHILRHTLLPKAGDRTQITPLLSVVTYYCLTNTLFDVADLIFHYFDNIVTYLEPRFKRKHNLALGHIISFLVHSKYQIPFPEVLDFQPVLFTNNAFHILYGKTKGKRQAEVQAEEEAEEAPDEVAPPQGESSSAPPPSGGDDFASQLGRIEGRLNQFIIRYERDRASDAQYRRDDRAWFEQQFAGFRVSAPSDDDEEDED